MFHKVKLKHDLEEESDISTYSHSNIDNNFLIEEDYMSEKRSSPPTPKMEDMNSPKKSLNVSIDEESHRNNYDCFTRFFRPIKGGSLRGSIFSLMSICFDTTCLSFPHAIAIMGLIPGSLLFLLVSVLSYWSLYLLMIAGRKTKICSYRQLIKESLGGKMALISDINNIIFSVGAQTAYIVTISKFFGETLLSLFGIQLTKTMKIIQMVSSMVFLQIPLSLLKNISKLQYASMAGSFVLVFTLIVMVIQSAFYYTEGTSQGRSVELFKNPNWDYLDSFAVFLFGYAPHNGLFLIFSEMKHPNSRRTNSVINRAMLLQSIIFFIIAYAGFFSLLELIPIIFISRPPLKSFDTNDYLITSAKILFFLSLHCLCAINFNLLRTTISSLFYGGKDTTSFQNFYVTAIMFICSNFLAFFATNVIDIIGVISGISVTFICYVFPVLCYVKTNDLPRFHIKNVVSVLLMSIICCVGLMSTIKSAMENITDKN